MKFGNIKSNAHVAGGVKIQKRKHAKKDWFGLIVLVSALIMGAGFLISAITDTADDIALQQDDTEFTRSVLEAERNSKELVEKIKTSTSTPQKTYDALRQALLNNDLEGALAQIHPDARNKYRDSLEEAFDNGELQKLGENLQPIFIDDSFLNNEFETHYFYWDTFREQPYKHGVSFQRDKNADWKITSI